MIAYTKSADIDRGARHRPARRPGARCGPARTTSRPLLRERFPDTLRPHRLRREIIATSMVNTHGQPGRDQLRPPDDRGQRLDSSPTCCGRSWPRAGSSDSDVQWVDDRRARPHSCRSTRRSICSSRRAGWPSGRRDGCCVTGHRRSTIDAVVDEFASRSRRSPAILDSVVTGRVAADIAERRVARHRGGCAGRPRGPCRPLAVDASRLRHRRGRARNRLRRSSRR